MNEKVRPCDATDNSIGGVYRLIEKEADFTRIS